MLDLEDRILTLPYLRVKIQTKVGPGGGEGGGIFFFYKDYMPCCADDSQERSGTPNARFTSPATITKPYSPLLCKNIQRPT